MAVAEHVQGIGKGIEAHLLLDDGRQPVDRLVKVERRTVLVNRRSDIARPMLLSICKIDSIHLAIGPALKRAWVRRR
ncbi:MAG: hypothetical protein V2J42_13715 [Wenzhouxiangella sp.]|nr:hypothetical protein [Wenzhouxiangella sp.]